MVLVQTRPNTSALRDGSRTITVHDQSPSDPPDNNSVERTLPDGTLRLRGGPRSRPRVAWDEGVVDNENCGRKKSKICCIYHKPKEFDESSSDSSSSESESDASDDGRARPRRNSNNCHPHHRPHTSAHRNDASAADGGNSLRDDDTSSGIVHQIENPHEPNAYEIQPKKSKG